MARYRSASQDWKSRVYRTEIEPFLRTEPARGELQEIRITFKEALKDAIDNDFLLSEMLHGKKKDKLMIEAAESRKWPAVGLRTSVSYPIGEDDVESSDIFQGGIYLDYSLWDLFFNPDLVSIAETKMQLTYARIAMREQTLYWSLVRILTEIESYRNEVAIRTAILETTRKGLETAKNLSRVGRGSLETEWEWRLKELEAESKSRESQERLESARVKLNFMMKLPRDAVVVITDAGDVIPATGDSGLSDTDLKRSVISAWNQRYDVKVTEMNLFLAAMKILEADRDRLPKVGFSLGVGNIPWSSNAETAAVVPMVTLAMPIFDRGDQKRQHDAATIDYDTQREKMVEVARQIIREIVEAASQVQRTRDWLGHARKVRQDVDDMVAIYRQLVASERGRLLDLYSARITGKQSEIEYERALLEEKLALQKLNAARSDPLEHLKLGKE